MTDIETYQINNAQIYDAIRYGYLDVFREASTRGINTSGIKIFMHPKVAQALGVKKKLTVGFVGYLMAEVPIIRKRNIPYKRVASGSYESTIFIYDPDWYKESKNHDRTIYTVYHQ